jgi:N-acetylmuramoyl-L-alanine amidase
MQIEKYFMPVSVEKRGRPGWRRAETRAVVVHWPAKAMQRARAIRNFWMSSANAVGASTQAIVDQDGVVLQMMPWDEVAFHVGSATPDPASGLIYTDLARALFDEYAKDVKRISPNSITVGFEMTHVDDEGRMSDAAYASSVELAAMLCKMYALPASRVLRHFDVVGYKRCPRLFVDDEDAFVKFRADVATRLEEDVV